MTAHYTCDHVREHAHINMPITTSTDLESLVVPVGNGINKFGLGSKLVGITSDGGTNLSRYKAILESNFDNTRVFDLEMLMFVMECLDYVLANACNSGEIDVKSDDDRVETEITRRNIKFCIIWSKNHKRGERLWIQSKSMWDFLVRGLLHLSKVVFISNPLLLISSLK